MAEKILNKILTMAKSSDIELQCSAILVLGELGLKDKNITILLKQKLASVNTVIKNFALDAVRAVPSKDYAEELLTILEQGGKESKKAADVLCAIHSDILPILKSRFSRYNDYYKNLVIPVLISLNTASGRKFLLDAILTNSLDVLKAICFSFREKIETFSAQEKKALLAHIRQCIKEATVHKKYTAITSYVILIGFINCPSSKGLLLSFVKKDGDAYAHVRRNALLSLKRLNLRGRHDDVAEVLFSLLENADQYAGKDIVDVLQPITFSKTFDKKIQRLLQSQNPYVRSFAISCLGRNGARQSAQCLVQYLKEKDTLIRQAAQEALGGMPSAVPLLLKALQTMCVEDEYMTIAHILKNHKEKITSERRAKLFSFMEQHLRKRHDAYKIYYTVLKTVMPEYLYDTVLKKIRLLKNRKKFKEAHAFTSLLSTGLLFTDEVKYEASIIGLKNSNQDIALRSRNNDTVLQLFEYLLKSSDIALLKRIKSEKNLEAHDLFYVGFHFSEKLFELKGFGVAILKLLIKKYPRSKVAPKAKKKLAQVGA
ncbi:MAG: HEAT repeat domain-containing protein [Candidatus Omnitrophota bacterium]